MKLDRRTLLLTGVSVALGAAAPPSGRRILVLGDSVPWGQGLRDTNKMHFGLARRLFAHDGAEPAILHYAASGALVGYHNGEPRKYDNPLEAWLPRETPRDRPTIYEQTLAAMAEHPDRRFDAIILNGGINDVSPSRIFDPNTKAETIRDLSRLYCREAMASLLNHVRQTFVVAEPNVKVLLLGYYNIFSPQSDLPDPRRMLAAFEVPQKSLTNASLRRSGIGGLRDLAGLRERLERNSVTFRDASREDLAGAVAAANRTGGDTFRFVDPGFGDEHAVLAPHARLWGVTGRLEPNDELVVDRQRYCGKLLGYPLKDRFMCERASVGHPNLQGAEAYADAIVRALAV